MKSFPHAGAPRGCQPPNAPGQAGCRQWFADGPSNVTD